MLHPNCTASMSKDTHGTARRNGGEGGERHSRETPSARVTGHLPSTQRRGQRATRATDDELGVQGGIALPSPRSGGERTTGEFLTDGYRPKIATNEPWFDGQCASRGMATRRLWVSYSTTGGRVTEPRVRYLHHSPRHECLKKRMWHHPSRPESHER